VCKQSYYQIVDYINIVLHQIDWQWGQYYVLKMMLGYMHQRLWDYQNFDTIESNLAGFRHMINYCLQFVDINSFYISYRFDHPNDWPDIDKFLVYNFSQFQQISNLYRQYDLFDFEAV
jgi:hypothetical protein